MKARVKATEKVIDETRLYIYDQIEGVEYDLSDLEIIGADPDYWTRLGHQYAGMAMQGILAHYGTECKKYLPQEAKDIAQALVEKYKKEEK